MAYPHPGNVEYVFNIYAEQLDQSMRSNPGMYMPGLTAVDIAEKFKAKILAGGDISEINIASDAWRRTCKQLGINHTYKALREYMS